MKNMTTKKLELLIISSLSIAFVLSMIIANHFQNKSKNENPTQLIVDKVEHTSPEAEMYIIK